MKFLGMKTIIVVAATLIAFGGNAKLKGLPVMKSYKDYNLVKQNVESIKYTVYAPKNSETTEKGEIVDFTAEIFFDQKGYRVKEIIYSIQTGKIDVIVNWVYDEDAGVVIEARTDTSGKVLARTEYLVNYKTNTVLARRYQDIEDPITKIITPSILIHEELWSEDAKNKKVIFKKTYFDFRDGIAAKQAISEEVMEKPYTLFVILAELTAPIDYTWLYDYNIKMFKATNRKIKKEMIYDGSRYEYKSKSKLLSSIEYYGNDKKLKNITTFVYSKDKYKNWTEVIQKEDNKVMFIVNRDIKYRL
jgi:Holliday junction resolvase-like predicted endonuclease